MGLKQKKWQPVRAHSHRRTIVCIVICNFYRPERSTMHAALFWSITFIYRTQSQKDLHSQPYIWPYFYTVCVYTFVRMFTGVQCTWTLFCDRCCRRCKYQQYVPSGATTTDYTLQMFTLPFVNESFMCGLQHIILNAHIAVEIAVYVDRCCRNQRLELKITRSERISPAHH